MSPDQVFSLVNLIAAASWAVLVLAPGRQRTAHLVAGVGVPVLLAVVYTVIVAATWSGSPGGFSSLPAVATLFTNPWLLLAGWTHYLAFDLLVGSWEVRDAYERALPWWFLLPCLVLTFLFGPAGWLLYLTLRLGRGARRPNPSA